MTDTANNSSFRSVLKQLLHRGLLAPFAWHFAETVARMAPVNSDSKVHETLFLAAALVAQNTIINKHVCLQLTPDLQLSDFLLTTLDPDDAIADLLTAKIPSDLLTQLGNDSFVYAVSKAGDGGFKPLILENNRLYLQRYWVYENMCAEQLRARAEIAPEPTLNEAAIRSNTKLTLDSDQIAAVQRAAANRLCIITGSPGTGKTTIISVVLTALLRGNPDLAIRLCAPTGKAQARLKEALQEQIKEYLTLAADDPLRATLGKLETSTIHRLLKFNPSTRQFTYHEGNPMIADLLIVDEVSMVALPLMVKLLVALPGTCKVILLGDKDQLAAVEIGAALAEMCAAWENLPPVARLTVSHRFSGERGIGKLKDAINAGECEDAWNILMEDDCELGHAPSPGTYAACEQALAKYLGEHPFRSYLTATNAEDAHAYFETFRILCATRQGPCGVDHINQCVQRLFDIKTYGHGYPIMVTVNDYTHRLFNGDIGICLRDQETDSVKVWFSDYEKPGAYRCFSIGELPAHSPVFAMTVHKAQGSGFDEVLLLLPPQENRVLTRELIYTGVTRAKKKCTLWANKPIFEGAIAHPTIRMSGLKDKLLQQEIPNPVNQAATTWGCPGQ